MTVTKNVYRQNTQRENTFEILYKPVQIVINSRHTQDKLFKK